MSGADINHTLILWERSGSPTVSLPCYCGFVVHLLLSVFLDYILLQDTQVSEDHEVRQNLCYITEGAPQRHAIQPVAKYTGTQSEPQWMDVEQGVFSFFNNLAKVIEVKQTNSRHCAMYRQISLLLRLRQGTEKRARCATYGNLR